MIQHKKEAAFFAFFHSLTINEVVSNEQSYDMQIDRD